MLLSGPNGIGKSTLLKIAMGNLVPDAGEVEWGYETHPGYFAQDHQAQFDSPSNTAEAWIWSFCQDQGIGFVRGQLALMLFSGDDVLKRLSSLSGGEAARLVFTRLAIAKPNVLVLDEPTNHLDLESIEALVEGLKRYDGTLIIVSHDRWFIGQLATRVVEIKPDEVRDYHGTYDEYVHYCGDDHLDSDQVVLKAKNQKKKKKSETTEEEVKVEAEVKAGPEANGKRQKKKGKNKNNERQNANQLEELMAQIEKAEARLAEIDARFCQPNFYEETQADEIKTLESERTGLERESVYLTAEWERVEEELSVSS